MSRVDSDEDDHPSFGLPVEDVLKTYTVYSTDKRIHFRVHTGGMSEHCVYYVTNSTFTLGTPDVELRAGDSIDGPVVAFACFQSFSGNVIMGISRLQDGSDSVIYEQLKTEPSLVRSAYVFQTDFGERERGMRQTYIWERTAGKRFYANYSCLDVKSGRLVAYSLQAGRRSLNNLGRLCITAQTSERFDELLLTSWFAIRENENRNAWHGSGFIFPTT